MASIEKPEYLEEPVGTPMWIFQHTVGLLLSLALFGSLMLVAASPALFLAGKIFPAAIPFIWLVVFGRTISVIGGLMKGEIDADNPIARDVDEINPGGQWLEALLSFVIFIGLITFHAGALGAISALVAVETGNLPISLVLAFILPYADAYVFNRLGISFAFVGWYLSSRILEILVLLSLLPEESVRNATEQSRGIVGSSA